MWTRMWRKAAGQRHGAMRSLPVVRNAGAALRDGGTGAVASVQAAADAVEAGGERLRRAGGSAVALRGRSRPRSSRYGAIGCEADFSEAGGTGGALELDAPAIRRRRAAAVRAPGGVSVRALSERSPALELYLARRDSAPAGPPYQLFPQAVGLLPEYELGVVRRVSTPRGGTIYDPRVNDHHHLICRNCGRVEDFEASVRMAAAEACARELGFRPEHGELQLTGLCGSCAAKVGL